MPPCCKPLPRAGFGVTAEGNEEGLGRWPTLCTPGCAALRPGPLLPPNIQRYPSGSINAEAASRAGRAARMRNEVGLGRLPTLRAFGCAALCPARCSHQTSRGTHQGQSMLRPRLEQAELHA